VAFQAAGVLLAAAGPAGDGDMAAVTRSSFPFFFFSSAEKKAVIEQIRLVELKTSAEIRVHLERKVRGDVMEHAKKTFVRLGMDSAQEKNAVLIFFETGGRRFAVAGGQALDEKLREGFWQEQTVRMEAAFRQDRFADGIIQFVAEVGGLLARHFPREPSDRNEFPDQISYSL